MSKTKRKSKMPKDAIQDFLCFVWLNDVWVPARMEMGMEREWYLVGLPGLKLDGQEVRVDNMINCFCMYSDYERNFHCFLFKVKTAPQPCQAIAQRFCSIRF